MTKVISNSQSIYKDLSFADENFHSLVEEAEDAIIIVGATGNIEYVNAKVIKWFEYERSELIGQPIEILIPKRFLNSHIKLRDSYIAHPISRAMGKTELEIKGRTKNGREFFVDISLSPLITSNGKTITAIIRDVNEKVRIANQIKFMSEIGQLLSVKLNSEGFLKSASALIVSQVADGCAILLFNDKGNLYVEDIAHKNPTKYKTLESLVNSVLSRGIFELDLNKKTTEHKVLLISELTDSVLNKFPINEQEQRQVKELKINSSLIIPLLLQGRLMGLLCFILDESKLQFVESDVFFLENIGARIILSIENNRLFNESQLAIKQREDILAIVSHDLRNPLNNILMSAQLLPRIVDDKTKLLSFTKKIIQSTDQMKRMIDDLMDFAKIQEGNLSIEKKLDKPEDAIDLVYEIMKVQADEKGLDFLVKINSKLPEIQFDKQRIVQALANLVGNAIKFTDKGGYVHLSLIESDGDIRFSVADSGSGISKVDLSKIFDRYWQSKRSNTSSVGLGLSITKGIIESHGGRIWVESELGEGSTFHFLLPGGMT